VTEPRGRRKNNKPWKHIYGVDRRYTARIDRAREREAAKVWATLEATPGFNERLRAAEAQLEAGGGILYEVRDGDLVRVDES
jgi:hypothetical protein